MIKGVSIVICCYNSSKLLPETLKHISRLNLPDHIPFEVIIVDNNSVDDTSEIAEKFFLQLRRHPDFQILKQPIQGLSSARRMGIDNAKYEYLIFCDDDNWLDEEYAAISYDIMQGNEKIGVLGGQSEAVTNGTFPGWFEKFQQSYSAGKQYEKSGFVTWENSVLWGAGMVLRKSALEYLFSNGYESVLSDRLGNTLTSGGDIELCYALRLSGWEILYEPSLKIKHFISQERLSWEYLRKLSRGFGSQKVDLEPYLKAMDPEPENFLQKFMQRWDYQLFALIKKIRGYGIRKLLRFNQTMEGDAEILRIEKTIGRILELMKIRGKYNIRINSVKKASWRKVCSFENTQSKLK